MDSVAEIIFIMIMAGVVIIGYNIGMERQEKVECLQWQAQAKELSGYWITNWQKNQCDYRGITIDAPVR